MDIIGFKESSLSEWDGKVSSIIWTAGCNWRCPYCHNHKMVINHDSIDRIDKKTIFDYIKSNEGWIDGICISGGEPTLQPDLKEFINEIKELNLLIKLETNGSKPDIIKELIESELIDCLALDIKHVPGSKLLNITGDNNIYSVLQSFNVSFNANIEVEYHTTICPSFIKKEDIKEMAEFLHNKGIWILQQYDPTDVLDEDRAGKHRYCNDELDEIVEVAKQNHKNVIIKNI